jgi:chromosome segregation ATPase
MAVSTLESLIHKVIKDLSSFKQEFMSFKSEVYDKFEAVDKRFESIEKELKDHKRILDNHTGALLNIESKIDIHNDMYTSNKMKIEKLDSRLTRLENG